MSIPQALREFLALFTFAWHHSLLINEEYEEWEHARKLLSKETQGKEILVCFIFELLVLAIQNNSIFNFILILIWDFQSGQ